ncbi:phosphatidylinositol 3-kinase regulatory subunit alpha [Dendroctonus ponderosae]
MDSHSDNRTRSWLFRLKYLKVFKNSNNSNSTSDKNQICAARNTANGAFTQSTTRNNLNDSTDLRRSETHLRKSIKKWHNRMKNCFWKNNRHLTSRPPIYIAHQPDSPSFSRRSNSDTFQTENIYTLDPSVQRKITVAVSEQQSHSNKSSNISLDSSSSRLSTTADIQPRSSHLTNANPSGCNYTPKNEVSSLAHQVWYWGPVSKSLVEAKLEGAPDGSFLVRDSASDRHIFSISFRSVGKTLHSRIEHTNSGFRVFDHKCFDTVRELIEQAVKISSEEQVFCYTKSQGMEPNYPVRLLKPISRYDEVRSLQSLSRFVIRQHINVNDIENLCLPVTLIQYLREENYF